MMEAAGVAWIARLPRWAQRALAAGALLAFLVITALSPLPIRPYLDFQVLYHADAGLLRGISPYDHVGQVNMIAQLAGVPPANVNVLPFPYPPWYALATAWLAWFPVQVAARLWLVASLLLLFTSAWLLSDGWRLVWRLAAFLLAMLFLPTLGSLAVGQYGFPVLLGVALMAYALRRREAVLTAVAAALLTFKPHLGGLLLLAVLIYLFWRRDAFSRRAILYCVFAGILLFCLGFLADRLWPVSYIQSLLAFQLDSGVSGCDLCVSLPVAAATAIPGGNHLRSAFGIGILLLVALSALWLLKRRLSLKDPVWLLAVSILIVLLASPYLLNYDFLLLLAPLFALAGVEKRPVAWILLGAAYVLPFVALGLLGRGGDFIFLFCAALLSALVYERTGQLDVSMHAS